MPRTAALRIALGIVAVLTLAAASVGACMSVKINWEFATTLARDMEGGFYLAATFAAVEVARILMPFLARGLKYAGLQHGWAHAAFAIFTCVSIASGIGYFAMNRSDASSQRGLQLSLSKGFQADLSAVTLSLERNTSVRSVGEIDADLKSLTRGDVKRAALEQEKASAEQREKDRKRLGELTATHQWKTTTPSSSKDAQAETLADIFWFVFPKSLEKADAQKWVIYGLIVTTIFALELLVGFSPFAAIMVLVWACKRPEDSYVDPSQGLPPRAVLPATFRKVSMVEARNDVLSLIAGNHPMDLDGEAMARRWGVHEGTASKWLAAFRREGLIGRVQRGQRKVITRPAVNGSGNVISLKGGA